jgi:hypothetical protein
VQKVNPQADKKAFGAPFRLVEREDRQVVGEYREPAGAEIMQDRHVLKRDNVRKIEMRDDDIVFDGVYRLSGPKATFCVSVKDNIITKSAPIAWRFKGQHIEKLLGWFYIDSIHRLGEKE